MKFYDELPEPYKDAVYATVEVHLSFVDRVRVLFGASLTINFQALTENLVGKHQGESEVKVGRVFKWRRKPISYVASNE